MLLWYNIVMEKFENKIKSNTEMVTISRAEYETLQTKLKDTQAELENTPKEAIVLPGSFASASAIAHIAVQKYVMYSPLYRLEQEFERMGLKLSRQTMSNWLLKATENWIEPIYNLMHKELCKQTVLHADETTLQVLKEKGKSSASKSYMWLYRTSGDAKYPICVV